MSKTVVVLQLARLTIPQKIQKARFIIQSMTGNANFTTPVPDLAAVKTATDELETAYLNAKGGGKDDTANSQAKSHALELQLDYLSSYVQSISNEKPEKEAKAVALSAGMDIRMPADRPVAGFTVTHSGIPGEVRLATRSEDRMVYNFQMTTTPEKEESYQTIGISTRARMLKGGLEISKRYYFRVAIIGKKGQEPFSAPLDLLVI